MTVKFVGGPPRSHWHFFRPQCFFDRIHKRCARKRLQCWRERSSLPPSIQISTAVLVDILRSFFQRLLRGETFFRRRCHQLRFASSQQQTLTMTTWSINCLFRPLCRLILSYLTQVCFRKPRVILTASLIHCLFFPSPF